MSRKWLSPLFTIEIGGAVFSSTNPLADELGRSHAAASVAGLDCDLGD